MQDFPQVIYKAREEEMTVLTSYRYDQDCSVPALQNVIKFL